MPSAHAPYGPSRIPMFIRCPGSVQASKKVKEKRDNKAAAEGTSAHYVREMCLELGFEPDDFLGDILKADGFEFVCDEDMIEYLRPGIEWVLERPGRLINEYQVDLSRWMPGQFGTLDVGLIAPDLITINDLKYGMGVEVHPERHEPTMAYALGLWENVARHETDATDFLIVIDQPRINGAGGEWRTTLDELLEFGEELKVAFAAAQEPDAPLIPGEKQCLFCPAKPICPAHAKWAMDMIDLEFEDMDHEDGQITLADIDDFDSEKRALIARHYSAIEKFLKSVKARVISDIISEGPQHGLKLIAGKKGARRWKDEVEAELDLLVNLGHEKPYKPAQLISPTEAGKLAKKNEIPEDVWNDFQDNITQSDGRPSLVDEGHKKPALDVADEFDDYDDDGDFED